MKHTRVPRTVRRDIWRLAMETLSIPSHHVFLKPNPESDQETNRKPEKDERTEPKIQSPKKHLKNPHTFCHIGLLLGLIDVVQCLPKLRTLNSYKQSVKRKFNVPLLLFQTERDSVETLYQHKSALPYIGCCNLSCSSTKRPRTLGPTIQKRRRYQEKRRSRRGP